MKILVINCGSSSIKFQLYDTDEERALAKGTASRIAEDGSYLKYDAGSISFKREMPIATHQTGFEIIVQSLIDKKTGVIKALKEVSAVGHRVVHGGDNFIEATLITDDVIDKLEACIPLAPLHNPANIVGIKAAMKILPDVPHVAVFDTAFHQTMPSIAYLYPLPFNYSQDHKLRRYGFHGTSCKYVTLRTAEFLNQPIEDLRIVLCHLGNGVTISAVKGGKSFDTSLGFTPVAGVMMGTRSGDIDPGIIFYLNRKVGLSLDSIDNLLNRESGLLGISGVSNDMRKIIENAKLGNERCQLAIEMFTYQVKKFVGAYAAALGGMDALVFTAGIGENAPMIREKICQGLEFIGVKLDHNKNNETLGNEQMISLPGSNVKVLVIPTNEERMIALDTIAVAFPSGK